MSTAEKLPLPPPSVKIRSYLRPDRCPFRAAQRALAHGETGEAWNARIAALPQGLGNEPAGLALQCKERRRWREMAALLGGAEAVVRYAGPESILYWGDDAAWELIRHVEPKHEDAKRIGGCWLKAACEAGRADWLTELLDRGICPNDPVLDTGLIPPSEDMRLRPLAVAVALGERECVQALLRAGANPNQVTRHGSREEEAPGLAWCNPGGPIRFTPLMLAEVVGDDAIATELIGHGADTDLARRLGLGFMDYHAVRSLRNPDGRRLRRAIRSLRRGAPFHVIAAEIATLSELDSTLLIEACVRRRLDVVRHLIELGIMRARFTGWPGCFHTPLHELAVGGDEVVSLLLVNGYRRAREDFPTTLLAELCAVGDDRLVRKALEAGYLPNYSYANFHTGEIEELPPLFQAVRVGATACIEALIECGADVNRGISVFLTGPESVEHFLGTGNFCFPFEEGVTEYGVTPLTLAEAVDNQSAITLLLAQGAQPHASCG